MHACTVLQKLLRPVLDDLDQRNARNLLSAVDALLTGRRLTLMELARHWPGAGRFQAPLKRLDRLLGNAQIQATRNRLYQAAMVWLLRTAQPVLVVDWSELKSDGRWHLLRAGVVARGRTLTVYEEVHPEHHKNSSRVESAFLQRLHALLPAKARPILVTDAGFRVPWFRAVEALGWHWLGRVRQRIQVKPTDQPLAAWSHCKLLYPQAVSRPRALGRFALTQSKQLICRLVLVKRAARGRIQRTRWGYKRRNAYALKIAQREREPWLLATSCSLSTLPAREIVRLYAQRMQIEQSFRDLKSHRYGCAFEDTLTRSAGRLQTLLLIQTLATLTAWLEGLAVAAEITKTRRICYSAVWIGWERLRYTARSLSLPTHDAFDRLRCIVSTAGMAV